MTVHLDELLKQMDSLDPSTFKDNSDARLKLVRASKSLTKRLETPWERMAYWMWHEPYLHFALKIAMDLDLFRKLDEGPKPMSLSHLSEKVGATPDFLERILYNLCAHDVLRLERNGYDVTPLAKHLCTEEAISLVAYVGDVMWPSVIPMNSFFRENGYENPTDPKNCPWQTGMKTNKTYFEWLSNHPQTRADFANVMKAFAKTKPPWVSWVPTEKLLANDDKTSPVIVDVGGSTGHDLVQFLERHPETAGRLVLQDLGDVVRSISDLDPGIQIMEHDFFTPQPVKGARVYFLHSILHDWPDTKGREILGNIKLAMKPGYSEIIIHDHMLNRKDPNFQSASIDLRMMTIAGAKERSEEDWHTLLDLVGLRIIDVWSSPGVFQQALLVDLK